MSERKLRRVPKRSVAPAALAAALAAALLAPAGARAEAYTHDPLGRVTSVTYDNGSSTHYTYDASGNVLSIVTSAGTTGVPPGPPAPARLSLGRAAPNPGRGQVAIPFAIPSRGRVTLRLFDAAGRLVGTLADDVFEPGPYVARFATDRWAAGAYFYRLSFEGRELKGRMTLVK